MFLDGVEIPVTDRVGEEGNGWAVAQATLASERGLTLMELTYRLRGALTRISKLIVSSGRGNDAGILRDFGALISQVDAACTIADQFLEDRMSGIDSIGDASIVKNSYSRALRIYTLLGLRLGGIEEQYIAHLWRSHHRELDGRFHEFLRLDHCWRERRNPTQHHRRARAGNAARTQGVDVA